jgi:hypothetical protein
MNKNKVKLPKKIKEKWVAALRSGKYRQGNGSLYSHDFNNNRYYCCLGVLGVVCGYKTGTLEHNSFPDIHRNKFPRGFRGITEINKKLATFNDNGKSFKWIASYIERYL